MKRDMFGMFCTYAFVAHSYSFAHCRAGIDEINGKEKGILLPFHKSTRSDTFFSEAVNG
jgi:hypothetical protein